MYRPYHGHQVDEYYQDSQHHMRWKNMGMLSFPSTQFPVYNGVGYYEGLPKLQQGMNVENGMRKRMNGNNRENDCYMTLSTTESDRNQYRSPVQANHPHTTMIPYNCLSQPNQRYCQNNILNNSQLTVRNQEVIVMREQHRSSEGFRQVTQSRCDDGYSFINLNSNQPYKYQPAQQKQQYYTHEKQKRGYYKEDQQYNKEDQQFYRDYQQKYLATVHYDSDHGIKQIYQPFKQEKPQQSSIELLIQQLHRTNLDMELFNQTSLGYNTFNHRHNNQHNNHHNNHNNHQHNNQHNNEQLKLEQMIQQVSLIEGMVEQNYKLYQIIDQSEQNQLRQSYNGNKLFMEMFGLGNMGKRMSESYQGLGDKYNQAVIIDYQQQLGKLLRSTTQSNSNQSQLNTHTTTYTNIHSIDLFVKLILQINDFYQLIYLFQELQLKNISILDSFNLNLQGRFQDNKSLPLLVRSILWHVNALRVLIWLYQNQMESLIATNDTYLSNSQYFNTSKHPQQLNAIQSRSITILQSLQELLAAFLQQIIIHTQSEQPKNNNSSKQPSHQRVWFFYYQYPQFNQQWICLLLDTLINAEMVIGLGSNCLLHLITINQFNPSNSLSIYQSNNLKYNAANKKSKKLTNPNIKSNQNIRIKKDQNICSNKNKTNDNANNNKACLPQQTINNMLSIISLLLFPQQNYPTNNSTPSLSTTSVTNNPICQLLQQPIRKMILKQMKIFQSKLELYQQNGDQMNNNNRKSLVINKLLLINKITNLISFFTSKLTQSRVNSDSDDLKNKRNIIQKRKNKDYQKKQPTRINSFTDFPIEIDDYDQHQTHQHKPNSGLFSTELKIMQMTLFVRQMCDILMLDGLETCSIQDIQQKGVFYYANQWVKGLSMKSMVGMLFQKVLRRKCI